MSKFKLFMFSVVAGAICISCNKNESSSCGSPQEIVFTLGGDGVDFNVDTKASAVTSVSSVYWEACASGVPVHAVSSYSVAGGIVSTGKYWPLTDGDEYAYMVSNVVFTTATGIITADNSTDIVVGTASNVTKSTSCSITLNHIFARTGTVAINASEGFTISNVSWTIQSQTEGPGTAGSYTIGSGWGSTTAALSSTSLTSDSDLYLMPGTYSIGVSYTLSKDAYSEDFTKTGTVSLEEGKVNNISATVSGPAATEITFSVSVASWGAADKTVSFN